MSTPTVRRVCQSELTDGSSNHLVSTELNSLANNAVVISSVINGTGVISNNAGDGAGNGAEEFRLHLHLAAVSSAFTAGTYIDGFLLCSDGTNSETASATGPVVPARAVDFAFPVLAQTAAQDVEIVVKAPIRSSIKVLVRNNGTGQALASSGNWISCYPTTTTIPSV